MRGVGLDIKYLIRENWQLQVNIQWLKTAKQRLLAYRTNYNHDYIRWVILYVQSLISLYE